MYFASYLEYAKATLDKYGASAVEQDDAPARPIKGVRTAEEPNRFASISMRFEIAGVSQAQAEQLVETYRNR